MKEPAAKLGADQEYDEWFQRQVQIGIDEADAGDVFPAKDVEAEFAALRAAAQRNLQWLAE
jgi:predicted transcriptional regulator